MHVIHSLLEVCYTITIGFVLGSAVTLLYVQRDQPEEAWHMQYIDELLILVAVTFVIYVAKGLVGMWIKANPTETEAQTAEE